MQAPALKSGTPKLEEAAFKGFEDPSTLSLEEIRLICAAVVLDTVNQERKKETLKLEHWL